jgi:hypothetical protein
MAGSSPLVEALVRPPWHKSHYLDNIDKTRKYFQEIFISCCVPGPQQNKGPGGLTAYSRKSPPATAVKDAQLSSKSQMTQKLH